MWQAWWEVTLLHRLLESGGCSSLTQWLCLSSESACSSPGWLKSTPSIVAWTLSQNAVAPPPLNQMGQFLAFGVFPGCITVVLLTSLRDSELRASHNVCGWAQRLIGCRLPLDLSGHACSGQSARLLLRLLFPSCGSWRLWRPEVSTQLPFHRRCPPVVRESTEENIPSWIAVCGCWKLKDLLSPAAGRTEARWRCRARPPRQCTLPCRCCGGSRCTLATTTCNSEFAPIRNRVSRCVVFGLMYDYFVGKTEYIVPADTLIQLYIQLVIFTEAAWGQTWHNCRSGSSSWKNS